MPDNQQGWQNPGAMLPGSPQATPLTQGLTPQQLAAIAGQGGAAPQPLAQAKGPGGPPPEASGGVPAELASLPAPGPQGAAPGQGGNFPLPMVNGQPGTPATAQQLASAGPPQYAATAQNGSPLQGRGLNPADFESFLQKGGGERGFNTYVGPDYNSGDLTGHVVQNGREQALKQYLGLMNNQQAGDRLALDQAAGVGQLGVNQGNALVNQAAVINGIRNDNPMTKAMTAFIQSRIDKGLPPPTADEQSQFAKSIRPYHPQGSAPYVPNPSVAASLPGMAPAGMAPAGQPQATPAAGVAKGPAGVQPAAQKQPGSDFPVTAPQGESPFRKAFGDNAFENAESMFRGADGKSVKPAISDVLTGLNTRMGGQQFMGNMPAVFDYLRSKGYTDTDITHALVPGQLTQVGRQVGNMFGQPSEWEKLNVGMVNQLAPGHSPNAPTAAAERFASGLRRIRGWLPGN